MAQHPYYNANSLEYAGTTSPVPARVTPYTGKTTAEHRGSGKGKDIRTRNHCFAIGDCKVTRADGSTYTIAKTRNNAAAKRRTKRASEQAAKVAEVVKFASNLSKPDMDEIRRINGL